MPAAGQNITAAGFVRCVEASMEGYLVGGMWTAAALRGAAWEQTVQDLAYGAALNTDLNNFVTGLATANLSTNEFVYTRAFDQPNSNTWVPGAAILPDNNGPGPPISEIYNIIGQHTGNVNAWRSHWESNIVNVMASNLTPSESNNFPFYAGPFDG